jgi:transcriptional regulator with XRE-family HTH domain
MPEGIDVEGLGGRLKRLRNERHLTLREVAKATGVSVPSLSRIERGAAKEFKSGTLLSLAAWLGKEVSELKGVPPPVPQHGGKAIDGTPDIVELHLRADRKLNKKSATALANLFRIAYEQLAQTEKQKGR